MVLGLCNCFFPKKRDDWHQENVLLENEGQEHLLTDPTSSVIEPGCEELFQAIKSHDDDKAILLLNCNKKLVNIEYDQSTPLIEAIRCNNVSIMNHLFKNGANVEHCEPKNGEPPLFIAIASDSSDVLDAILKTNVDINRAHGCLQVTALHYCVTKQNFEAVCKLVSMAKIDVNKQDKSGNTALHDAVDKDIRNIVFAIATAFVYTHVDFGVINNNGITAYEINSGKSCKSKEILNGCIEISKKVKGKSVNDQMSAIKELQTQEELNPILIQPNLTMYVVSEQVQITNKSSVNLREASNTSQENNKPNDQMKYQRFTPRGISSNSVLFNDDPWKETGKTGKDFWETIGQVWDEKYLKGRQNLDVLLLESYRSENLNTKKWYKI